MKNDQVSTITKKEGVARETYQLGDCTVLGLELTHSTFLLVSSELIRQVGSSNDVEGGRP